MKMIVVLGGFDAELKERTEATGAWGWGWEKQMCEGSRKVMSVMGFCSVVSIEKERTEAVEAWG